MTLTTCSRDLILPVHEPPHSQANSTMSFYCTSIGSPGAGLGAWLRGDGLGAWLRGVGASASSAPASALLRERSFLRLSISRFFSRCCFFL